jgi:hypothetical protein
MRVTMQLSGDSCDWDCNSRMIAKTDLRTEGTQEVSLYTGKCANNK